MELVAAIQALRSLPLGVRIDLHSDSQYLIYGMSSFISKWERDGGATVAAARSSTGNCGRNSRRSMRTGKSGGYG
jgi:ribonuclease HI